MGSHLVDFLLPYHKPFELVNAVLQFISHIAQTECHFDKNIVTAVSRSFGIGIPMGMVHLKTCGCSNAAT